MTDTPTTSRTTAPSGSPGVGLGVAWALSSLGTGVLGWLALAVSDWPGERRAGWFLLALAVLGAVTALRALTARPPTSASTEDAAGRLALAASASFVVGGVVVVALVAGEGTAFVRDLALLGGVPVAGGLVTGRLALRRRST